MAQILIRMARINNDVIEFVNYFHNEVIIQCDSSFTSNTEMWMSGSTGTDKIPTVLTSCWKQSKDKPERKIFKVI